MKNLVLIFVLSLFAITASAQLNNISALPRDTNIASTSIVPAVDTTGGSKKPYAVPITKIVQYGSVGNFKTVGDSSILGSGNVPFKTISDSIITGTGNIEFKTVNGEYIVGSGDINTTSNLEDSIQEYTTGDTLFVLAGVNVVHVNPVGTVASLVIVLSDNSHLSNWVDIFFTQDITALSVIGNTNTVFSPTAITAAADGDVLTYKKIGTVHFRKP